MGIQIFVYIFCWFANLKNISTEPQKSSSLFQARFVRIDQINIEKAIAAFDANSHTECALLCKRHSECEKSAITKDEKCYLLSDEDVLNNVDDGDNALVIMREILPKLPGKGVSPKYSLWDIQKVCH